MDIPMKIVSQATVSEVVDYFEKHGIYGDEEKAAHEKEISDLRQQVGDLQHAKTYAEAVIRNKNKQLAECMTRYNALYDKYSDLQYLAERLRRRVEELERAQ